MDQDGVDEWHDVSGWCGGVRRWAACDASFFLMDAVDEEAAESGTGGVDDDGGDHAKADVFVTADEIDDGFEATDGQAYKERTRKECGQFEFL